MYIISSLILLIITVFLYVYWVFKKSHQFFDQYGIPYIKPHWFFGNMKDVILMRKNIFDGIKDNYDKLKSNKIAGIYILHKPQIMLFDLELIKKILIEDFAYFHDRGLTVAKEVEPFTNHLVNMSGDEWKNTRIKLTSTFTSGKMKMMFPLTTKCAQDIKPVLSKYCSDDGGIIDINDLCARYTTDVIGSCAFGIDTNSLRDPQSEFRKMGKAIFQPRWQATLRMFLLTLPPSYIKLFGLEFFPKKITDYFLKIVKDMVKYREENNITRGDFLDLLIAMKNHKEIEKLRDQHDDADLTKFMAQIGEKYVKNDVDITIEVIATQCFMFFLAGFGSTSSTLVFLLFELAQHPDIQNKLRDEILSTLRNNNDELTYEIVRKMPYLEMVIEETLRKYPLVPLIIRQCTENYKIPDTDTIIKKGTPVTVPLIGFNSDSKYFDKPNDFYPEHFSAEAKSRRPRFAFLPFGEGPRVCIAERFARMQVIVGVVHLLKDFSFDSSPKTKPPLKYSISPGGIFVKGDVWLKCRPLH